MSSNSRYSVSVHILLMLQDPEGEWGDAWIYEDKVIYVQKKFVAIPKSASTTFDSSLAIRRFAGLMSRWSTGSGIECR